MYSKYAGCTLGRSLIGDPTHNLARYTNSKLREQQLQSRATPHPNRRAIVGTVRAEIYQIGEVYARVIAIGDDEICLANGLIRLHR